MLAEAAEVPCLKAGPIAEEAREFVDATEALGPAPSATVLRCWCVPLLFDATERIFASGVEPIGAVRHTLGDLAKTLQRLGTSGLTQLGVFREAFVGEENRPIDDLRTATGEHYGQLFQAFSKTSFWDEPVRLLSERLERNGVSVSELAHKTVLDAGCGGGRYTAAWRRLGARRVVGLDFSQVGIADAARRVRHAGLEGVVFQRSDVLTLPFGDDFFDVVFSNGVLHHTTDWAAGVSELVRVLRPAGLGWLYLIEDPGGLFWDVIEILRAALRQDGDAACRAALRQLGIPANRIFYMLDHVKVPINVRTTPAEVEDCLRRSGAVDVRRLQRGTSFDRVEHIAQGDPYAAEKYGVGENRYVFTKP